MRGEATLQAGVPVDIKTLLPHVREDGDRHGQRAPVDRSQMGARYCEALPCPVQRPTYARTVEITVHNVISTSQIHHTKIAENLESRSPKVPRSPVRGHLTYTAGLTGASFEDGSEAGYVSFPDRRIRTTDPVRECLISHKCFRFSYPAPTQPIYHGSILTSFRLKFAALPVEAAS